MKRNDVCKWGHLSGKVAKQFNVHYFFCANNLRAKGALEVTHIRDFDIYLIEALGHRGGEITLGVLKIKLGIL